MSSSTSRKRISSLSGSSIAEILDELVAQIRRYERSRGEPRATAQAVSNVIALFARDPISTASISDAALFRLVEKLAPTLIFDEVDTVFGAKAKEYEDLRRLLNAGFQRGAKAYRCVGDGSKQSVEGFAVFCPKVFAGIGDVLPDTVADRSIPAPQAKDSQRAC
jgi:hypothetical protein